MAVCLLGMHCMSVFITVTETDRNRRQRRTTLTNTHATSVKNVVPWTDESHRGSRYAAGKTTFTVKLNKVTLAGPC